MPFYTGDIYTYEKTITPILIFFAITAILTGCGPIGDKAANLNSIYGITTFLSFVILLIYLIRQKQKDKWYLLLFISVFIVNLGYYALGTSQTLKSALIYNRISYIITELFLLSLQFLMIENTKLNELLNEQKKWKETETNLRTIPDRQYCPVEPNLIDKEKIVHFQNDQILSNRITYYIKEKTGDR